MTRSSPRRRDRGNAGTGIVGSLAALLTVLIILDVFFLGWVLIDEPVLKSIQGALAFAA